MAPNGVFQGSGVLVDSLNVLTVAHKVANFSYGSFNTNMLFLCFEIVLHFRSVPNLLRVRLGEWDAFREIEIFPVQEFVVARVIIHPSFNGGNLKNDVAILRLATAVPLGQFPTIATACLPTSTFYGQR